MDRGQSWKKTFYKDCPNFHGFEVSPSSKILSTNLQREIDWNCVHWSISMLLRPSQSPDPKLNENLREKWNIDTLDHDHARSVIVQTPPEMSAVDYGSVKLNDWGNYVTVWYWYVDEYFSLQKHLRYSHSLAKYSYSKHFSHLVHYKLQSTAFSF